MEVLTTLKELEDELIPDGPSKMLIAALRSERDRYRTALELCEDRLSDIQRGLHVDLPLLRKQISRILGG